MVNIMSQGEHKTPYIMEFVADTAADLNKLSEMNCAVGSTCLIISTSEVYMKNSEGEWIKL